jgi:hypothetical protein
MSLRSRIPFFTVAPGLAAGLLAAPLAALPAAAAEPKSKQVETEAEFVSFDEAAKTVTVKVRKPGNAPKALAVRQGKEAVFKVKPEGSVLVRTTVKMQDGTAGSFKDLEPGRKVRVFWVADPDDPKGRMARSISVFVPAEEQGEDAEN